MAHATDVQQPIVARSLEARKIGRRESGAADIADLFDGIDSIDAALLAAVERRTELARMIAQAEAAAGKTDVAAQEQQVVERFESLGQEGRSLGRLLNRLAALR